MQHTDKTGPVTVFKFKNSGKILMYGSSRSSTGGSLARPPFNWHEKDAPRDQVIKDLLYMVNRPMDVVQGPTDWKDFRNKYISGLGLKRENELYKNSIALIVYRKGDSIAFAPMVKVGNAFKNGSAAEIIVGANEDIDSLYNNLENAFSLCI